MKTEIMAPEQNNTWSLVDLSKDKRVVGCKWVYRIKRHLDGTIERYKASLVEKGYSN